MLANGFATIAFTRTRELTMSSSPGRVEVPPVSRMWSIALNWVEVKKNCIARWISSAAFSMNGRSTSASKLSGSPPDRLAFSASSLRQPVVARDVLGELVAAERLLAGVDRLVVAQHRDVHDARAEVDDGDVLVAALARQLLADQLEGGLHGVGLDVHHQRLQPRRLGDRDAVLDLLLAGGGDQDLDFFRSRRRGPEHLEVEVDLVERERDVLVRLAFDLDLELFLAQAGRARRSSW